MVKVALFTVCLGHLYFMVLSSHQISNGTVIRLVGGKHPFEGRIEVFYREKWGAICDHKWSTSAASVACKMLGYPDVVRFTTGGKFGRVRGKFWLDDVVCVGTETSLADCSHGDWGQYNCERNQVAGVVCKPHERDRKVVPKPSLDSGKVKSIKVKLIGRVVKSYISQGLAKIQLDGKGSWGNICSENWSHQNARVLCGQLGFPDAGRSSNTDQMPGTRLKGPYLMSGVRCDGTESSLVSCNHSGFARGRHQCNSGKPVVVTCIRANKNRPSYIRLRSGVQLSEGRVELPAWYFGSRIDRWERRKIWGSVCDDGWDLLDANVVCRSLGYGTASEALWGAYFGQGSEMVVMSKVRCTGKERYLTECGFSQPRNCDHYSDASVKCNAPKLYGHKIRLAGSQNPREGRVEVFRRGRWGAVCGDHWTLRESVVVCRQLGLGYAKYAFTHNKFEPVPPRRGIIMSGVRCRLNEVSLFECRHNGWNKCSSPNNTAGVMCVDALPDLVVNVDVLRNSRGRRKGILLAERLLATKLCAFQEGCFTSSAAAEMKVAQHHPYHVNRRLLMFTLQSENRGGADFVPNVPKEKWKWHSCHKHFHSMEVFATYNIVGEWGHVLAQGHKASFCLEDTKCDDGVTRKWNCTGGQPQGISPNCYDIYRRNIDCQWVDLTDVYYGYYFLKVRINPEFKIAETDYKNNVATCEIYDYYYSVKVGYCYLG